MKTFLNKIIAQTPSKVSLLGVAMLLGLGSVLAQDAPATEAVQRTTLTGEEWMLLIMVGLTVTTAFIVLIVAFYVLSVIRVILAKERPEMLPEKDGLVTSLWKSIDRKLTGAVPLTKEKSILLDHNYDGIRELDNHLPPWWVGLFYGTIAFGIVYMLLFHVFNIWPLSGQEYVEEMAAAEKQVEEYRKLVANNVDENNVILLADEAAIAAGKTIFQKECVACHGAAGEGGIGPNLTDTHWMYGGSVQEIFTTIKYGSPDKTSGMVAWEKKLKPGDIQNISSYILNELQGSNPPNAKEPEGEEYTGPKDKNAEGAEGGDEKISLK